LGHRISGSKFSVKFDYAGPLKELIKFHYKKEDVETIIDIMEYYNLTPENIKE
jgi:hypothetical protein